MIVKSIQKINGSQFEENLCQIKKDRNYSRNAFVDHKTAQIMNITRDKNSIT